MAAIHQNHDDGTEVLQASHLSSVESNPLMKEFPLEAAPAAICHSKTELKENPAGIDVQMADFTTLTPKFGDLNSSGNSASTVVKPQHQASCSSGTPTMGPSPNSTEPKGSKRATTATQASPSKKKAKGGRRRKSKDDIFDDPDAVLGPETSPLYGEAINIQAILDHPTAKAALASAGIDLSDLSIEEIQRAIACFREDGRLQHHDEQWQVEAQEASRRRAAGDFDEYLRAQFVETFGEESETLSDSEQEENGDMDVDHNHGDTSATKETISGSLDNDKDTKEAAPSNDDQAPDSTQVLIASAKDEDLDTAAIPVDELQDPKTPENILSVEDLSSPLSAFPSEDFEVSP